MWRSLSDEKWNVFENQENRKEDKSRALLFEHLGLHGLVWQKNQQIDHILILDVSVWHIFLVLSPNEPVGEKKEDADQECIQIDMIILLLINYAYDKSQPFITLWLYDVLLKEQCLTITNIQRSSCDGNIPS